MSFIRKIRKNGKTYLAEVENKWIDGRCVQKHIRYIGKEVDNKTVLTSSLSDVEIQDVKMYGTIMVLDYFSKQIKLSEILGNYGNEILSMVYAHCSDYKSVNKMEQWFKRTDLSLLLSIDSVTEHRLLNALDSLNINNIHTIQQQIFKNIQSVYHFPMYSVIYDVTNTYFYGNQCPIAKLGHDKEGVKGRPLVQIGLVILKHCGIPVCHNTFSGNIHDSKTLQDFITYLKEYKIDKGLIVYDRGIISARNIKDIDSLHWKTLCGLPIKGKVKNVIRSLIKEQLILKIANRVRLNNTILYVCTTPHSIGGVNGTLALCFNEQQRLSLREARYDKINEQQQRLKKNLKIKNVFMKYFNKDGSVSEETIKTVEEFDGYSCIFTTEDLSKEDMVNFYFEKDIVEKAFHTMKGITRLQPIRHWLHGRVVAHIFVCYLSYLLLSLLQYRLSNHGITAEAALTELETMYKVYLRDSEKGFCLSRVVTLTKKQELILKTIDPQLLKT